MQIPETPQSVVELDLMKRLNEYANGEASWTEDGVVLGQGAKEACRTLHTNLTNLVSGLFAFILDRVTAREMEAFTMHDRVHGRKVAHLMWHILKPERRAQLTPPEIAILVVAAHLHDLGMGLSPSERVERLKPDSELWDKLEIQDNVRSAIEKLRDQIGDKNASESVKRRSEQQLFQAEEALLTQDTRERHATKERYEEIIGLLSEFHQKDPTKIPDIEASLSFDGDSFCDKLIDVCVSHNEDADALVSNDEKNLDRPRFPKAFPVGRCNADLHTVAAALRLADILDFDRERTPAVLFHYLLPTTLGLEHRSVLEWSKHLAISNWHIERDDIIFRGRSQSHILHHAVVQFCSVIADELKATHATFSPLGEQDWPFRLPLSVKADIHEEGYRYVPYKFELDDDRVYSLLMGGAIYDNPLVAVRELVQNAVDACKLRDSLTQLYEEYEEPSKLNRIFIRYEEPTLDCEYPRLTVRDTGTGMDAYSLERYFLQVGRSYYNSSDFNQFRVQLRKKNFDFAPVSEFGIGFLSAFLLADHVEVETAMWEPLRGDTAKRLLQIDGPTRLIRLDEQRNDGAGRFKGTRITLFLSPKILQGSKLAPASWADIKAYLLNVCQDLPYRLNLEYMSAEAEVKEHIDARPMSISLPQQLEQTALRIPIDDQQFGLQGEIVLINPLAIRKQRSEVEQTGTVLLNQDKAVLFDELESTLLRGGFNVGRITGLPSSATETPDVGARLRLTWKNRTNRRYLPPNLARDNISENRQLGERVFQLWVTYLLRRVDTLPRGQVFDLDIYSNKRSDWRWMEEFSALTIYQLARQDWILQVPGKKNGERALTSWERRKGPPLYYGFTGFGRSLLDLILPRVTTLRVKKDKRTYVNVPINEWDSIFKDWHDYIHTPVYWDSFVDYEEEINDFLFYDQYADVERLNVRFKGRFMSWSESEIANLRRLMIQLIYRYDSRFVVLDSSQSELFRRTVEVAGDLKIGSWDQFSILKELKITVP